MEYKYLLQIRRSGLYEEFLEDSRCALIPFQDPERYSRSPLENSSFLVGSAHPDESIHGAGFVARLSGATAEFLGIRSAMITGRGKSHFSSRMDSSVWRSSRYYPIGCLTKLGQ
jgi:hypothetical protein